MALEPGQFKLLRGVVEDQNEDGTLQIRIPGELPGADDSDDPEVSGDSVDGIPCIAVGATRGGYAKSHRVAVAYYDEQIAPQDRYLVLGVLMDGTNADDDAHADAGLLRSPQGGAKVICHEDDDGDNPEVLIGSSAANRGVARIADLTVSDGDSDPSMWGGEGVGWLQGLINVFLVDWTVPGSDGGAALKAAMSAYIADNPVPTSLTSKISTASDKVFCDDDVGG